MAKPPAPTYTYPTPVLSPWTDDHANSCGYGITTEKNAYLNHQGHLVAKILHRVDCSILSEAIKAGIAICAIRVSSPKTLKRETFISNDDNPFAHEVQLVSNHYVGDDKAGIAITLTPFIVANDDQPWNITDHYHTEYSKAGLENFYPGKGGLLAAGNGVKISADDISPESIVDISITDDSKNDPHRFTVDLDGDRIIIKVDKTTHEQIQRTQIGKYEPVLHSTLYLHAITEALRNLGDYPDTRWTESLTDALTKHNCPTDTDEIRSNPLLYSQILLEHPLQETMNILSQSPTYDEEGPF